MRSTLINVAEEFPHLPRAPIVEAVFDLQARSGVNLEEHSVQKALESRLDNYEFKDSLQMMQIHQGVNMRDGVSADPVVSHLGWKGIRFQSLDKKYIAQFNRDGFVFSRLEPYENWDKFYAEGKKLWDIYVGITQPIEIHRIGLRYINRFEIPNNDQRFENYLVPHLTPPLGLNIPIQGFLHQDDYILPADPYGVTVIRTVQRQNINGIALILDIDVSTTQRVDLDESNLRQCLLEMRWIKNKVFFGSVAKDTMQLFQ